MLCHWTVNNGRITVMHCSIFSSVLLALLAINIHLKEHKVSYCQKAPYLVVYFFNLIFIFFSEKEKYDQKMKQMIEEAENQLINQAESLKRQVRSTLI
jgi:hypothetical protein